MIPAPGPTPSDEQELDAILNNIDALVEHQCKKATARQKRTEDTPVTAVLSRERFKKTQAAFQQLSAAELEDSGEALDPTPSDNGAKAPKRKTSFWPWNKRPALG